MTRTLCLSLAALFALFCSGCAMAPGSPSPVQSATTAPVAEREPALQSPQDTRQRQGAASQAPLPPGRYDWNPERAPDGPLVVIVSLPEQMAYVYRNGVLIGRSTVSTGKPGHETPTGVFTILQKRVDHESNIYNGAKMPYMQRLTWDGIALHAGQLPGYPASHGCVRLPLSFSEKLFSTTSMGTTVIVTDSHSSPVETVHPALLSPVTADSGTLVAARPVSGGDFVWRGENAAQGPVTLLLSTADRTVYVYRNGVSIGQAAIELRDPGEPLGAGVYTMLAGYAEYESAYVPGQRGRRWMAVDLPARTGELLKSEIMERVKVPPEFARKVYDIIQPGTTLMVTDLPATEQTTTGTDFVVMSTPATAPDEG